jgi:hypothetical protein
MWLHLFFLPNFPGAIFIQRGTSIPDSRVVHGLWQSLKSLNFQFFDSNILCRKL